jgi:sugar/nucleoside kinase (ribokinase family)
MYDVITIGSATQDVFLKTGGFKNLGDEKCLEEMGLAGRKVKCFAAGDKVELDDLMIEFGGGGVNPAVSFARQGFSTAAVVKVGDDYVGRQVIENMKKFGVKPFVSKDKKGKTAYSSILLLPSGERTILVYRGAAEKMTNSDVPFSKLKARWGYVSPSNIPFSVIEKAVETFKRNGAKVAMNPSGSYIEMGLKKLKMIFRRLDVVIVNREEAAELTGVSYGDERGIFRKFDKIIDGIAVMTEGKRGSIVSDGRYMYRAGVYKEGEVVDRTGAGDAFGSGFVAGLMQKNEIGWALKLASANATAVIEDVGAQTGILGRTALRKERFKYLDFDIEPLV